MTDINNAGSVPNPVDAALGRKEEPPKKTPRGYGHILKWLQVIIAALFLGESFILTQPTIERNLTTIAQNITGLSAMTLFMLSFSAAVIFGIYTILSVMWTGGITLKLIWAKITGGRHLFHRGEDRIYRLLVVGKTQKTWKYGEIEYEIDGEAVGSLENGTPVMPTLEGYSRGIDFKKVSNNSIILNNPIIFEDRLHSEKIKEVLKDATKRDPAIFLYVGICGLLLCLGAVYMYNQMQAGNCQTTLVQMAARCGESALELLNKTQADKPPGIIPKLPLINN